MLCRLCQQPINKTIPGNERLRYYCSPQCRDKFHRNKLIASGKSRLRQQKIRDARASTASPDRFQCLICMKWYKRPAHHAWQRHVVSAYEYKKENGLAVSHGIISDADRERMRLHAIDNDMPANLQKWGKRTRYTHGDPKAKAMSNPWGKSGAPKP